jgi:UDP-hydrolysing UDP-N-acetyl-D-glucosamine 2-epimerase
MKILGFTSIQSDYDLLSSLYKVASRSKKTEIKLIVSGAHLSSTYGHTISQINRDGIEILQKIETLFGYDSKVSRVKSAALLMLSCLEQVDEYNPDFILYAGDREDTLIASMIGAYLDIPTVHFYGGDHVQDGYVDNPVRHAVSKISTYHFVSCQQHKYRLISIGEEEKRIYSVGSIALDRFVVHEPMKTSSFNEMFPHLSPNKKFALMIYHPIDGEECKSYDIINNVAHILNDHDIMLVILAPNTDPGNYEILESIRAVCEQQNAVSYSRIERNSFLELYKRSEFIIGNSSSGIMEAASIKKPAINVGLRQTGRLIAMNVVFSGCDKCSISEAFETIGSIKFKEKLQFIENPYGDGNSAEKAFQLLKSLQSESRTMLRKIKDPLL